MGLAVAHPAPPVPGPAVGGVSAAPRLWLLYRGDLAVPAADEMLANKLLLETDERSFLATAHRFPYR